MAKVCAWPAPVPGSGKDWGCLGERQSPWKVLWVASSTRQEERHWAEWWWGGKSGGQNFSNRICGPWSEVYCGPWHCAGTWGPSESGKASVSGQRCGACHVVRSLQGCFRPTEDFLNCIFNTSRGHLWHQFFLWVRTKRQGGGAEVPPTTLCCPGDTSALPK